MPRVIDVVGRPWLEAIVRRQFLWTVPPEDITSSVSGQGVLFVIGCACYAFIDCPVPPGIKVKQKPSGFLV